MAPERLLVNFFYAYPVGHAVEALHYCLGYHAAAPDREVAVALNAETPELDDQLAIVERCGLFLSPHTGFAFAALAVGTPWLTLSGGRWFEYFFNRVPFRSVIPDTERHPCFSQFAPVGITVDGDDGPRTPSMSRARIRDDLGAIVRAARELLDEDVTYEQALSDYFRDLLRAHGGNASSIWSIDDVHASYIDPAR